MTEVVNEVEVDGGLLVGSRRVRRVGHGRALGGRIAAGSANR